jgi:hypothetical protein
VASVLQGKLATTFHLSYGQIFWFCGVIAAIAGLFVTWTRPRAVPDMLARWRNRGSESPS